MTGVETELKLRNWRYGQVQAEHMIAALLHIERFENVDPQHPLGGPDGLKDVVCKKDGLMWIAAAYFPPTLPTFLDIKRKFIHDVAGVLSNKATAFIFFVNQHVTIGERQELTNIAPCPTEIYHLERIVSLLSSPKGCGIRLEYLRIFMTEEEQWAFWSTMNSDLVRKLAESEMRLGDQIRRFSERIESVIHHTISASSSLSSRDSSLDYNSNLKNFEAPTALLSITTLCWIHRMITEGTGYPQAGRGNFRNVEVWIGSTSNPEIVVYRPPSPDQILRLTTNLLEWWRRKHNDLRLAKKSDVALGLANFHHKLLSIHPFLDANGRVARSLLDQAARELISSGIGHDFTTDKATYYSSLRAADFGDLGPLQKRIMACLW